jgi:hypothetical protein
LAIKITHGNSYQNEELHHLYEIVDRVDDSVFKYGISAKPIAEDGLSERIREQINLLNRVDNWQRFYARILAIDIKGRKSARVLEQTYIKNHELTFGERPRGNPID